MTSQDDERLDLRALDPTADEARFERLVRSTVRAAVALRRRSAELEVVRWWRPARALAASLALAAWLPVLLGAGRHEAEPAQSDRAAELLTLARSDATPSPAEVLGTLGENR